MFLSPIGSFICQYFLYAVDLKGYKSLVNHVGFYQPLNRSACISHCTRPTWQEYGIKGLKDVVLSQLVPMIDAAFANMEFVLVPINIRQLQQKAEVILKW